MKNPKEIVTKDYKMENRKLKKRYTKWRRPNNFGKAVRHYEIIKKFIYQYVNSIKVKYV